MRIQRPETVLASVGWKKTQPVCYACFVQDGGRRQASSRTLHTSPPKEKPATLSSSSISSGSSTSPPPQTAAEKKRVAVPLAVLPLSQVLRTYFITSISSSPTLLEASSGVLRRMLNSRNPLFRIDKNPLMRGLLWETFYKQFCAGETEAQVAKSCADLRDKGYAGVILEYALEVLADAEGNEKEDVAVWRQGMLDTVQMAAPGDFVGLKWSGMGPAAMRRMADNAEPTERMSEAMNALCNAATEKGISLLPAAEETWSLTGFHNWCLKMQRVYNTRGKSVVYSTYQAYLKQTPETLAQHLEYARQEGFTFGIKMVRGAYLGSDNRSLIHPSIEATHNAYDGIASALIYRRYNDVLSKPSEKVESQLPAINVVLATHNDTSVKKAFALRKEQAARGESLTSLTFAQLQGMADEVSMSLIALAKASAAEDNGVKEKVFKCTTWGSMYECLNYLLRRAAENKDAAGRTGETRDAMRAEVWRRMKGMFGLA